MWRGACRHPGAGVHHDPDLRWNRNLHKKQAERTGQGHHLEAQMERKAWSHMEMVLLTQAKGEIGVVECQVKPLLLVSWRLQFLTSSACLLAGTHECHIFSL